MMHVLTLGLVAAAHSPSLFRTSVGEEDMRLCHTGFRDTSGRCRAYVNTKSATVYPAIGANCTNVTWETAHKGNNWGNCFNMTLDEKFRYITTNNVPDFFTNLYCPIGIGLGYCVDAEIKTGRCMFPNLTCGGDNGLGSHKYGDVWVPTESHYKIPLAGNPTRADRPGDMYDAELVEAEKTVGPATGVAINGIVVQGPNDAGDVSIDEAGIQLTCGGHVTPPLGNSKSGFLGGPPMYHFHKSPDCLAPFLNASIGVAHGAKPYAHGQLMGWAMDGFGIYSYQDVGGAAPVVDECGGHFGPTDSGEVVYHYHSRNIVPYHLACQGPSLSRCATTQRGTSFCHPGCGSDVCVQPGTRGQELRKYLAKWNATWLDSYTVNDF